VQGSSPTRACGPPREAQALLSRRPPNPRPRPGAPRPPFSVAACSPPPSPLPSTTSPPPPQVLERPRTTSPTSYCFVPRSATAPRRRCPLPLSPLALPATPSISICCLAAFSPDVVPRPWKRGPRERWRLRVRPPGQARAARGLPGQSPLHPHPPPRPCIAWCGRTDVLRACKI